MISLPQTAIADITTNMSGIITDLMPVILFLGGIILGIFIISSLLSKDNKEK